LKKLSVGIDLGGTKIAVCVMDEEGKILAKEIIPTKAEEGPTAVIKRMKESVYKVLDDADVSIADIEGIGMGIPGPLNAKRGVTRNLPNLPGWEGIPLVSIMKHEFGVRVIMENDANSAAWGEYLFGAGKYADNFLYITISTGIGGGVVIKGRLLKGESGNAAEIGHMTINFDGPKCGCGNFGCWEAYASGTALARFAEEGIRNGIKTKITDYLKNGVISAESVFLAAKDGDGFAKELLERESFYLGVGLANVINAFNPQRIAIGGGLTNQWDVFYDKMMEVIKKRAFSANTEELRVVKAELGSDAGVIGAASLLFSIE